ncbi:MAG: protein-methionine-sulfoxide reductase heme-binding subunit MsrQ [Deltaproteobacteria bacterium]
MTIAQRINGWTRKVPAWLIYIVAVIPPAWYIYQGFTGRLGPDPTKTLERDMGQLGLQVLIAVIAITPIRDYLGVNLVKFRRALGVTAFFYILLHFLTWFVLDMQDIGRALSDIVKRPYILIGMSALVLMLPLALSSNNWSIRKLNPKRWKSLHKLTYLIVPLGGIHFYMLRKLPGEPLIYLAIIAVLLLMRVKWRTWFAARSQSA